MHIISLTNFELQDNEMKWTLNNIQFKIKYMFDINYKFINTFKLIPLIQACCLATSYNNKVSINSNIAINEETKHFISEYAKMQYMFNMEQLDIKIKSNIPKIKIIFPKDIYKDEIIDIVKVKNIISSWSGGKDSYLTIKLLQECGYKVVPTTTKWNTIAFNRGTHPFINDHDEINKNIIASVALGNKMKLLFTKALNDQNIFIKNKQSGTFLSKKELPMILYHSFYMNVQNINNILYGLHKNIKHVFMGDEADVNGSHIYCGFKVQTSVGQGFKNKKLINNYLTSIYGKNSTQIHSLLYPLHGPLEVKLLIERYKSVKFSSCLTMIGNACSKCPKCLATLLTCKSLGYDPSILGINQDKLIKNFKSQITDSYLLPDDEVIYWYVKNCVKYPEMNFIVQELLDETQHNIDFDPLIPLKNKYDTIPKFIRKDIIKIYNEYA